ncbi:unnamed protein product [Cuscuta epithymum]|uniref:MADS-box domain-containing protein n=2 Tax=Cuscuta epithymum TaxID=186058 RepID=A0AAV0GCD2_9ASTE|nr:unnamed protein product [Cuscuta epithymum]
MYLFDPLAYFIQRSMGRAKLNLELIPNKKSLNLTFKKRKEGILKKIKEFTTLCDVNACMIIYGLPDEAQSSDPTIWPTDRSKVERMIQVYKEKGAENGARAYGLPNFYMDRKKKAEEELKKLKQKKLESKYPTCPKLLDGLSKPELENFVSFLDRKLRASNTRLEMINFSNNSYKNLEEEELFCHFRHDNDDYIINNMNSNPGLDNSGFVTPLQQVVRYDRHHPNMILDNPINYYYGGGGLCYMDENPNPQHPAAVEYSHPPQQVNYLGFYRHPQFAAEYYMDRTATLAPPPYMGGGDLPPLPPSIYLQVNELKSMCTLPAVAAASVSNDDGFTDFGSSGSYYLEDVEDQREEMASALPPAMAGSGGLPQLKVYQEEPAGNSSCNEFNRYYNFTNHIKRY